MIINQDNIYIQTIIYGLIWAIICFLFYNVANENKNEEKKEKISTLNAYANRYCLLFTLNIIYLYIFNTILN